MQQERTSHVKTEKTNTDNMRGLTSQAKAEGSAQSKQEAVADTGSVSPVKTTFPVPALAQPVLWQ